MAKQKKKVKNKKVKLKMKNEKNEKEMSGTINTPDYIQIPFKRCNICNKTGHISSSCYSHPNLGTLNINTANYCLACRSREHVAKECNMYPKTSLNIKGCTQCSEKRIFAMHLSEICQGVDDTYNKFMEYKLSFRKNIKMSKDNISKNETQQNFQDIADSNQSNVQIENLYIPARTMSHKHSIIGGITKNILISFLTSLIQTIIFICLLIQIRIENHHDTPKNNIFLYIGVTFSFLLIVIDVIRCIVQKAFAFWRRKNKKTIS